MAHSFRQIGHGSISSPAGEGEGGIRSDHVPPDLRGDEVLVKPMTPTDLWWRVGIGVLLIIVAVALQVGAVSGAIFTLGVVWIVWAVVRGVLQVRKAEEIQRERRR